MTRTQKDDPTKNKKFQEVVKTFLNTPPQPKKSVNKGAKSNKRASKEKN